MLCNIGPFGQLHRLVQEHLDHIMVEGALLVAFKNIGSSWKQIKTVLQEMPPRAGSEGFYAGNRHAPRLIQPAGLVGRNTGGGNGYMKTV